MEANPLELVRLVRSLAVLALPAEEQFRWLASLGLGEPALTDELALELENAVLAAPELVAAGWLRSEALQIARNLDAKLESRSGPAAGSFWSIEALRNDPEWADIRVQAVEALMAL
ncbi:hypothetical protein ACFWEJ_01945 [Promicromonospora sp. NPDC060204]|uniref:hypothetical protein n=1 Tax=Promicromonospora sp. NPDC060204 TaxID=3347071 RepID=UPI003660527A